MLFFMLNLSSAHIGNRLKLDTIQKPRKVNYGADPCYTIYFTSKLPHSRVLTRFPAIDVAHSKPWTMG